MCTQLGCYPIVRPAEPGNMVNAKVFSYLSLLVLHHLLSLRLSLCDNTDIHVAWRLTILYTFTHSCQQLCAVLIVATSVLVSDMHIYRQTHSSRYMLIYT